MLSYQSPTTNGRRTSEPNTTDFFTEALLSPSTADHVRQYGDPRSTQAFNEQPDPNQFGYHFQDNGTVSMINQGQRQRRQQQQMRETQQQEPARPGRTTYDNMNDELPNNIMQNHFYQNLTPGAYQKSGISSPLLMTSLEQELNLQNAVDTALFGQSFQIQEPGAFQDTGTLSTSSLSNQDQQLENALGSELLNSFTHAEEFSVFHSAEPDIYSGSLEGFGLEFVPQSSVRQRSNTPRLNDVEGNDDGSRRGSVESLANYIKKEPSTPTYQTKTHYLPMTPEATPCRSNNKNHRRNPTADMSPVRQSLNQTIMKAGAEAMKRGSSWDGIMDILNHTSGTRNLPSPPNTVPMRSVRKFEAIAPVPAPDFSSFLEYPIDTVANKGYNALNYSPVSNEASPVMSSKYVSPELSHLELFGNRNETIPNSTETWHSPQSRAGSFDDHFADAGQHGKSHSRSHSHSDNSNDAMLDSTFEPTGITPEEIASFMSEQDPSNSKWTCLYPECSKKFGRKENIKSHIQTHLGDRPYQCTTCMKRFVRQHDLKRHVTTHTGAKPFKCKCGCSFARHDALTRHRQRGMCIGALDGVVRREVKRGRPKKASRPDTEERKAKAAKTRKRVLERASASASNSSASPERSMPSTPHADDTLEGFDSMGPSPRRYSMTEGGGQCTAHSSPWETAASEFSSSSPVATGLFDFSSNLEPISEDVFLTGMRDGDGPTVLDKFGDPFGFSGIGPWVPDEDIRQGGYQD